ncbi:MAG: excinuclease ABC subunit UvrA [Crocinitomicaceae bacterium]|nr:excinuclease ABC subunit UvrA [Crocinitomicaceae bacterium]
MSKSNYIEIKGARVHNLTSIDVKIKHGEITVITGVSGSGKSSLAFDTIYAEGQRKYIESLSSYARQFLGKLDKPETDYIKGLSPAIAIQQKTISTNPRSTVGTVTEIYDYLKILFAKIGKTYSPISGDEVKKHNTTDVIDYLKSKYQTTEKIAIICPLPNLSKYGLIKQLDILINQGYRRILHEGKVIPIADFKAPKLTSDIYLVIDRLSIDFDDDNNISRYADSIQLAFAEGSGECGVYNPIKNKTTWFNNVFELDGISFQVPNEKFFTFNNPYGACKKCEGFGHTLGIDHNLVIPDKSKSVFEGAIQPWNTKSMKKYANKLILNTDKHSFPIHRPIEKLNSKEYELLWNGNKDFKGINDFFKYVEKKKYKIHFRVLLSRYRGKTLCDECKGSRVRKDASYVKINNKSIIDCSLMTIEENLHFFSKIKLNEYEKQVGERVLKEIINRLETLNNIGLPYLSLQRASSTLSGGESQRINLATSIGSSLVGSIYVLDEPSIGLHSKDTEKLVSILKKLKQLGNTVIIVEHDETIMKYADNIIDLGPKAGIFGGELVFNGKYNQIDQSKNSLTADYLLKKEEISLPLKRRKSKQFITIHNASKYNLKMLDVKIPLQSLIGITGVSGSGKSTLIKEVLHLSLSKFLSTNKKPLNLSGNIELIKNIELIDQNPIGKSSRSNPVTYLKAYDDIRKLYASQALAKLRSYKPGFFSFNVIGGRCEMCEGEGEITVSMQFMADIHLPCENCNSTRFKSETLEVKYRDKSIADILNFSIDEALFFFRESEEKIAQKIADKIKNLSDVGLGYLKVGQSSSTMSGGEAQRIKLASFLAKGNSHPSTLFIFDEPTTGLHFDDVSKLLIAFDSLIKLGHSIVVIEHNMDVIKCADHIIDLGPEGGKNGGQILFEGTPEELIQQKNNSTAIYLKEKLI